MRKWIFFIKLYPSIISNTKKTDLPPMGEVRSFLVVYHVVNWSGLTQKNAKTPSESKSNGFRIRSQVPTLKGKDLRKIPMFFEDIHLGYKKLSAFYVQDKISREGRRHFCYSDLFLNPRIICFQWSIFLAVHKERTLPFRKNASPLLKFFIINETADSKSVLRGEYLNEWFRIKRHLSQRAKR